MATRKSQSTGKSTKSRKKAAKRPSKKVAPKVRTRLQKARPATSKKKTPKPKQKPKRKPTARERKLKAHKDKCSVCNHPDVKEINARIMKCQKASVIARDYPELTGQAILRHMHTLGLDHKRVGDVLNFCDEVMSRTLERKGSPSYTDASRCAEMAAKIRGKLKPDEGKLDVTIKLDQEVKKQVDNLTAAIGGLADGDSISK